MIVDLDFYGEFNEKLQDSTRAYYTDEVKSLLSSTSNADSVSIYLKKVEVHIGEESKRCSKDLTGYIDPSSKESIVGIVLDEFLRKQIAVILDKGLFNLLFVSTTNRTRTEHDAWKE